MSSRQLTNWMVAAILGIALLTPAAALAFYKPARIMMPHWFGVTCHNDGICIDDPTRISEARKLRDDAFLFVSKRISPMKNTSRIVFCAHLACSDRFGRSDLAGYNVGTIGMVILKKGWHPHFVRHEMIHHLQNSRMGSLTMFLRRPAWYREGMAYSLSKDPREPIPAKLLECWRTKFNQWYYKVGHDKLWSVPTDPSPSARCNEPS